MILARVIPHLIPHSNDVHERLAPDDFAGSLAMPTTWSVHNGVSHGAYRSKVHRRTIFTAFLSAL
jgi:hypothetical protein